MAYRLTPEQAFDEKLREMIDRLDIIISLLGGTLSIPADEVTPSLVSAGLPSAPKTSANVLVGTTATPLAENNSLSIMRVEVTNDDVAQQIYLDCNAGVLTSQGRRLNAQQTIAYTINKGQTLYAICLVATVNVRVAYSQSPIVALKEGPIVM